MMSKKKLMIFVVIVVVLSPMVLFARTQPASFGRAWDGTKEDLFLISGNGALNPGYVSNMDSSSTQLWVMPLEFDTPGTKNICISGKKNLNSDSLSCAMYSYNRDGTPIGNTFFPVFNDAGVATKCVYNVNIVASSMNFLYCNVGKNYSAELYGVDYTP
jgi:hypothetical protein